MASLPHPLGCSKVLSPPRLWRQRGVALPSVRVARTTDSGLETSPGSPIVEMQASRLLDPRRRVLALVIGGAKGGPVSYMSEVLHIVCPHCDAINRIPTARLDDNPKCG